MGYEENHITEEYDRQYNLFYLSLHPVKKTKGLISGKRDHYIDYSQASNIAVYDISQGRTLYLFDTAQEGEEITHLLFEVIYREVNQEMGFNRTSSKIQNNKFIEKREPVDRVWVCQFSTRKELHRLWSFRKNGEGKRLIAEFGKETEWRIDVYNQKIRLIHRQADKVEIKDYEW
jgi:hypothetical protein